MDFLEKPVERDALLRRLRRASRAMRRNVPAREDARLQQRLFATLTPREREVFDRIVAGKLNKQIADELGISLRTVKAYRAHVMEKLGVATAAELGRFAGDARDAGSVETVDGSDAGARPRMLPDLAAGKLHFGPLRTRVVHTSIRRISPSAQGDWPRHR